MKKDPKHTMGSIGYNKIVDLSKYIDRNVAISLSTGRDRSAADPEPNWHDEVIEALMLEIDRLRDIIEPKVE